MKNILALLLLTGILAHAETYPKLTAAFSGTSKTTGHRYKITQAIEGQWQIADISPCQKYPCDINAHTKTSSFTPYLLSENRMADGDTEIKLSKELFITYINNAFAPPQADGSFAESYWQLSIKKSGQAQEDIKLDFYPILKTQ